MEKERFGKISNILKINDNDFSYRWSGVRTQARVFVRNVLD